MASGKRWCANVGWGQTLKLFEGITGVAAAQLGISLLACWAARRHHDNSVEGLDIFRIDPVVAWVMIIGGYGFAILFAIAIAVTQRSGLDDVVMFLGEALFFFSGLYGIYCITLRITVDDTSLIVSSVFGRRQTLFADIHSVTDKIGGKYHTLCVRRTDGKRLLTVTSSFVSDYSDLVWLLQRGIRVRPIANTPR